jgi:hypothetical protein
MKYIFLSFVLAMSFLILATSVSAEFLHTNILRRFYLITGFTTGVEPEETTTTMEETTTTTTVPEETTTTIIRETTTTTVPYCPTMLTCDPEDPCFSGWELCKDVDTTTTTIVQEEGCPGIAISMWCPDCDVEKYGRDCLCPMAKGDDGCSYWDCGSCRMIVPDACPELPTVVPACAEGTMPSTMYNERGCAIGVECVPKIRREPVDCPESQRCPDDSIVPCRITEGRCICDPCPISEDRIPEGCVQEVDKEAGVVRLLCRRVEGCPDEERQAEMKHKCVENNGVPVPFQDPSGCVFYDCKFEGMQDEVDPNPIYGYEECPSVEEVDLTIRKCRDMGMFGTISFEGGCKVVKCVEQREERCKMVTAEMRLRIEEECGRKGLKGIKDFDENGCAFFACAGEDFCKGDLPKEAIEECSVKGGEMIIKKDDRGCIVYSNCVERGDERGVYVEPMERVPEPTELLAVAFKLEQLKVELDKLARQADDIADYYASVGDPDEHRFRRASSMFNAIKGKIDEVKNDLRDRLDTLTPGDMEEIRFDIRSIKESLKDIAYVMLSNSDDVIEMIETEAAPPETAFGGTDCGTDVQCFDSAFRVCKPVTAAPEGRAGPVVTIKGLEGGACLIHVEAPENMDLPPEVVDLVGSFIYMDCRITTYSLGIKNAEEDILPYCEGPLMELAKRFGNQAIQTHTETERFGGPGGCEGDMECKRYCEEHPKECLGWCHSTGECPPETMEEMERLMVKKGVAFCGNKICENEFESSESCPGDCMGGLVMCTYEEKVMMKECADRGGHPQSDPSVFHNASKESCKEYGKGCCETYTGCLMPEMGRCGCSRAEGCAMPCTDYSYGQMVCERHSGDGCVWLIGEKEVQGCSGCMNNGVCDVGECSECMDCLRAG